MLAYFEKKSWAFLLANHHAVVLETVFGDNFFTYIWLIFMVHVGRYTIHGIPMGISCMVY